MPNMQNMGQEPRTCGTTPPADISSPMLLKMVADDLHPMLHGCIQWHGLSHLLYNQVRLANGY
jgi:hypothetical protein